MSNMFVQDEKYYLNKIKRMKKKIKLDFPTAEVTFKKNPTTKYVCAMFTKPCGKKWEILINEDSSYTDIKRNINKFLTTEREMICEICTEYMPKRVGCNVCGNGYCTSCYINIFKAGKGVMSCPYCKTIVGTHCPDFYMDVFVAQMKYNFGLGTYEEILEELKKVEPLLIRRHYNRKL
jgi:hypothetical protein